MRASSATTMPSTRLSCTWCSRADIASGISPWLDVPVVPSYRKAVSLRRSATPPNSASSPIGSSRGATPMPKRSRSCSSVRS